MNNSKRGGAREGAGRKPKEDKKQTIAICLSPELIAHLPPNRSQFIQEAIAEKLSRHG